MPLTMKELVDAEVEQALIDGQFERFRNAVRQQAMLEVLEAHLGDEPNFIGWLKQEAGVE